MVTNMADKDRNICGLFAYMIVLLFIVSLYEYLFHKKSQTLSIKTDYHSADNLQEKNFKRK